MRKTAGRGADQYMLRLPDGVRDALAKRAGANGRSINSEIVDAIEKHLEGADRITELWNFFQENKVYLEDLRSLDTAVEILEAKVREIQERLDRRD